MAVWLPAADQAVEAARGHRSGLRSTYRGLGHRQWGANPSSGAWGCQTCRWPGQGLVYCLICQHARQRFEFGIVEEACRIALQEHGPYVRSGFHGPGRPQPIRHSLACLITERSRKTTNSLLVHTCIHNQNLLIREGLNLLVPCDSQAKETEFRQWNLGKLPINLMNLVIK